MLIPKTTVKIPPIEKNTTPQKAAVYNPTGNFFQLKEDVKAARRGLGQMDKSLSLIEGLLFKENEKLVLRNHVLQEVFNYERIAERVCNNARMLPIATGISGARKDVEETILEGCNVEVGFTEKGWFIASIPSLLPRKEKGDASWIRATYQIGMKRYFDSHERRKFKEPCTIIFDHRYSPLRQQREMRDHDNIEINVVVDITALYVLIDDAPLRLSHYYCSHVAASKEIRLEEGVLNLNDDDRTLIYVVPSSEFKQWLNDNERGDDFV